MSSNEKARSVLITGCSTGIGRATAIRLAKAGHRVTATARRKEVLADLAAQGLRTLALDVNDEASMKAAVSAVEKAEGAIDVLVNNAGYSQSGAVEEVTPDQLRKQFDTNVFGLVRMCQLVLPGMRKRGSGRIVNIGSMGGVLTFPGGGVYHATKHAVEALSDALRFEVGGFGVQVVLIQPGLIRTEFSATVQEHMAGMMGGDGPYAAFNANVARATADAYVKGPLAPLGGEADDVARVIEKAITAKCPKARYRVTASATVLMTQRSLLPDWAWDGFLKTQFPQPGKAG